MSPLTLEAINLLLDAFFITFFIRWHQDIALNFLVSLFKLLHLVAIVDGLDSRATITPRILGLSFSLDTDLSGRKARERVCIVGRCGLCVDTDLTALHELPNISAD